MARPMEVDKLRRFVEAYLGEAAGNQADAARAAGYTGNRKTLSTTAARLLKRVDVQEMLAKLEAKKIEKGEIGRELTPEELRVWWSDVVKGVPMVVDAGGNNTRKAPPSMAERLRASELLGKSKKMFVEDKSKTSDLTQVNVFMLPDDGRPVKDVNAPPTPNAKEVPQAVTTAFERVDASNVKPRE